MCLACEQDAMWFAYLRRKGLITEDGYLVEEPPFLAGPVDETAVQSVPADGAVEQKKPDGEAKPDRKTDFSCDDPAA
jgi:hypothetical protein